MLSQSIWSSQLWSCYNIFPFWQFLIESIHLHQQCSSKSHFDTVPIFTSHLLTLTFQKWKLFLILMIKNRSYNKHEMVSHLYLMYRITGQEKLMSRKGMTRTLEYKEQKVRNWRGEEENNKVMVWGVKNRNLSYSG